MVSFVRFKRKKHSWRGDHSSIGVLHIFQIVQLILNCAKHHIYWFHELALIVSTDQVVVFWIINDYSLLDNPYHLRITSMYRNSHQRCSLIVVCTPLPFLLGGGGWTSNQVFKKGGLYMTSTFTGGWLFSGRGCNFHIKNKLKCLMTKKVLSKNIFLCHN